MVGTVLVTAEDCLLPLILLGRAISSSQEKVAMASARLCRKRCYRNAKSNATVVVQIWQARKRQLPSHTHIITYMLGWHRGSKKQTHLSLLSHSYACLLILLILLWPPNSHFVVSLNPCIWDRKHIGLTE